MNNNYNFLFWREVNKIDYAVFESRDTGNQIICSLYFTICSIVNSYYSPAEVLEFIRALENYDQFKEKKYDEVY